MVPALAFLATAVASLFAEATFVRYTERRRAGLAAHHLAAWTVALAMFAGASAALAVGVSTGWDTGTFRVFYLLGAVLNVPWLAFGTVCLLLGATTVRRSRAALVFFTGLAVGVVLVAPMEPVSGTSIPVGSDVFGAFPRVLAAVGSSVGAIVIFAGAVVSAVRYARDRSQPSSADAASGTSSGDDRPRRSSRAEAARLAGANVLIALGTLVLSSGGLVQGLVGHDEAFSLSLAIGISVIYAGFLVAEGRRARGDRAVTT
jgi:hypothetical protein